MTEKISKVSNPLTVIAIFAGIAEVAGTVTLPFVDDALQSIFIWYVMGMPVLIVFLFFGILIFKREILYAPSDFREDESFIKMWEIRKDVIDLREEISDVQDEKERDKYIAILDKIENVNNRQISDFQLDKRKTKKLREMILTKIRRDGPISGPFIFNAVGKVGYSKWLVHKILKELLDKGVIATELKEGTAYYTYIEEE